MHACKCKPALPCPGCCHDSMSIMITYLLEVRVEVRHVYWSEPQAWPVCWGQRSSALPPSPFQVRLSLYKMLGDLENKDLQLSLAMQDLTIATGEIRKAAEMRSKMSRPER